MLLSSTFLCLGFLLLAPQASSQLIGPVGATTPLHKKTRVCNILDFGGVADNSTDVAPSIIDAFDKCVKRQPGSRLVVPAGNYLLKQSIVLSKGTNWAFQLDGLITAEYVGDSTGTSNFLVPRELILEGFAGVQALNSTINEEGDGKFLEILIVIINGLRCLGLFAACDANEMIAVDFEFYSENGLGAIQGQGYLYRIAREYVVLVVGKNDALT
jgi:rhamnogalacturonan hydrolase